jgi:hypothetical protein
MEEQLEERNVGAVIVNALPHLLMAPVEIVKQTNFVATSCS